MDMKFLALVHTLFYSLRPLKVPHWPLTQQCRNRAGSLVTMMQVKNACGESYIKSTFKKFFKYNGKTVTDGHSMKTGKHTQVQVLVLGTAQMETFTKNACSLNSQQIRSD